MSELPQKPSNRRANIRKKPRGAKSFCRKGVLGLGNNLALALLDLTQAGASLLIKSSLEPHQEVELELYSSGYPKHIRVPGSVVWSVAAQEGAYCIGVRFDRYLAYADLQRLT